MFLIRRRFTKQKKELARRFVQEKIKYFNGFYNFKISRVAIRNQKSRWGSCSSKGNLNFNYKIIYLRPELADCLVVHELCHLAELNHSKNFWGLVSKIFPDYKRLYTELRKTSIRSI